VILVERRTVNSGPVGNKTSLWIGLLPKVFKGPSLQVIEKGSVLAGQFRWTISLTMVPCESWCGQDVGQKANDDGAKY
jgi:hypothetical protein